MLSTDRRQSIVDLTRDLVRVKSLAGQEREVAQVVIAAMQALGYNKIDVDALGNVVGHVAAAGSRR